MPDLPQSIYAIYANKYRQQTVGEASFFHSSIHGGVKGLRFILPDKEMEFSDTSFIGTDPAGFFFYDDFEAATSADNYKSDVTLNPRDNQLIAWVLFYRGNTLVAEFLADDYFDVVQVAGMIGYTASGQWKTSTTPVRLAAELKKDANSTCITLDMSESIHLKATMTTNDPTLMASRLSDILGQFYYQKVDEIKDGVYVSYTNDRLIFYKDNGSTSELTGLFIPNGRADSQTHLGINKDAEVLLSGTRWDDAM